jgi:hypothetical protein
MTFRSSFVSLALFCVVVLASCDLVDPMRPSPQPDSETFGNLFEAGRDPAQPEVWIAKIQVGVPRALGRVDDAQPTPEGADGLVALVRVTPDTIVIANDGPAKLEEIRPGTEVVAIPSPGTTTVYGDREIHFTADQLMDFTSYARWRLPKLELSGTPVDADDDPARVNSTGIETAPIPVGDGSVLYFTARLREPELPDGAWNGARRQGLANPAEGERSVDRVFRAELGDHGWATPEPVPIPGVDPAQHVKLTWVSPDELRCYVTVSDVDQDPWVGVSGRDSAADPWGAVDRFKATEGGDAFDAVAMSGSAKKTLFATTRSGGGDLYLHDPEAGPAQPLQPEINSGGLEWAPRVGPRGELYFNRADRQLRFQAGRIDEVRLPGPHRTLITEAAPTADGTWLFFALPKFRPIAFDFDIMVAPIDADGSIGAPVPVDDWRL